MEMRVVESERREVEGDSGHQTKDDHYFHQHQLNKHRSTQRSLKAQLNFSIIFRTR